MPINRVPKRNRGVFFGTRFGGICDWYLRFGCSKLVLGDAQDRPEFVCLSAVCVMFVALFAAPFWSRSMQIVNTISRNNHSKTGSHPARDAEMDRFRCHLAEVVALSSNGDCGATPLSVCLVATQLVTCTCGATCPRGKRVGCAK